MREDPDPFHLRKCAGYRKAAGAGEDGKDLVERYAKLQQDAAGDQARAADAGMAMNADADTAAKARDERCYKVGGFLR